MNINHLGKLYAYAGISSPEITTLTSVLTTAVDDVAALETSFVTLGNAVTTMSTDLAAVEITVNNSAAATSTAVENSIVKRDNLNGTVFTLLDSRSISKRRSVIVHALSPRQWS